MGNACSAIVNTWAQLSIPVHADMQLPDMYVFISAVVSIISS